MVYIYPRWIGQCECTQPVEPRTVFAVLPATHVNLHTNHVNTCRRPGIEFQRLQIIPFLCWINTFKYTTNTLPYADYTMSAHTISCTRTHASKHRHTQFKRATARFADCQLITFGGTCCLHLRGGSRPRGEKKELAVSGTTGAGGGYKQHSERNCCRLYS